MLVYDKFKISWLSGEGFWILILIVILFLWFECSVCVKMCCVGIYVCKESVFEIKVMFYDII